jgi:hypothetical protein
VFAFAWMFSGWGSFSSRKLLTEKVIITKQKENIFRAKTENMWDGFPFLNVHGGQ